MPTGSSEHTSHCSWHSWMCVESPSPTAIPDRQQHINFHPRSRDPPPRRGWAQAGGLTHTSSSVIPLLLRTKVWTLLPDLKQQTLWTIFQTVKLPDMPKGVQDGARGGRRWNEKGGGLGVLGTGTGSAACFWGTEASAFIQTQHFGHRADERLNLTPMRWTQRSWSCPVVSSPESSRHSSTFKLTCSSYESVLRNHHHKNITEVTDMQKLEGRRN